MSVQLLSNVRAVTPSGVVDDATVAMEDGVIVGVEEGRSYLGAEDGRGAYCLPGLIDSHCDAIEREISPRPTAVFDFDFALRSLEQRFLGAGITTAYHGVRFADEGTVMRSLPSAARLVEVIAERCKEHPRLDHRVLHRVPVRSSGAMERARACLLDGEDGRHPQLLSFEDHTPGQGQYRDLGAYRAALRVSRPASDAEVDAELARQVEESRASEPVRLANLALVRELAASGSARVVAHDCVDEDDLDAARASGASVAEFPVTLDAARYARSQGMPVVLGAPNVLLGGSHSGNVAAEAVIAAGLCTGLASDYLPSSLLAAAFDLAARGVVALHEAIRLVTAGPAEVIGEPGRGVLEAGADADLILVVQQGRWPVVRSVLATREDPVPVP